MSDKRQVGEDGLDVTYPDQLATPALSPISEYGDQNAKDFGRDEAEMDKHAREASSKKENKLDGQVLRSNFAALHERRHTTAGSPKALELYPLHLNDFVPPPESLSVGVTDNVDTNPVDLSNGSAVKSSRSPMPKGSSALDSILHSPVLNYNSTSVQTAFSVTAAKATSSNAARPGKATRSVSTPLLPRNQSSSKSARLKPQLAPVATNDDTTGTFKDNVQKSPRLESQPSPMPSLLPIPPLSLPTYLHLELASDRPSALYIHRSATNDFPYESARIKFERLQNFLLLPPQLEQVLWFGAMTCLDAWLYMFTILPLRFMKAIVVLSQWAVENVLRESRDVGSFVYLGVGRVWQRRRASSVPSSRRPSAAETERSTRLSSPDVSFEPSSRPNGQIFPAQPDRKRKAAGFRMHRRTRSTPSALLPNHKADLLQGLLIAASCTILMWFDASRMYHSIRGQSAIKLYVIYNVLEVFDRLFSALGQDILECLFSKETLERNEDGRSKIFRPMWMFMLALVYNVVHATALFYQVVTLNVAVNSYSNALLTLLMSNQFVEIKGTVFKKFEKENLFQLTCADVVERFQLWLMLLIIALRNIVEVGGLSISLASAFSGSTTDAFSQNATAIPLTSGFVLPKAFTIFPKWIGELLGPFLVVLGSEALVDWCKHSYISKFNNIKPNIYGRFLDVLAKDYYTHAFADQNLTKRLGLPVVPLSCLFIRACIQTYKMFVATQMPMPIASAATVISLEADAATTPGTVAALKHIDHVFRRALGRSTFGAGYDPGSAFTLWSIDDIIAFATMAFFFLAVYLVLLALKLVLGMALLSFARNRYRRMKDREQQSSDTNGKRVGGWGVVEVDEDKRRWIYDDDLDGLRELKERHERGRRKSELKLDAVQRYTMAAKRIW